jgi:hypothetical protein
MYGLHKRVGEVRKPDEIVTLEVLHANDKILEGEWSLAKAKEDKAAHLRIGSLDNGQILHRFQGKEIMLLIDALGTLNSIMRGMKKGVRDPHFKFVVMGRTKGVQQDRKALGIPCMKITRGTDLRPGIWVQRLVNIKYVAREGHGKLLFVSKKAETC